MISNPVEYLKFVRKEASKFPEIITISKERETELLSNNNQFHVNEKSTIEVIQKITLDKQFALVDKFKHLNNIFLNERDRRRNLGTLPDVPIEIPKILNDEDIWLKFCYGSKIKEELNKNYRVLHDESVKFEDWTPPYLYVLIQMNQALIIYLIEMNSRLLDLDMIHEEQVKWLYSLMVSLEKPLIDDYVALLRKVALQCKKIRSLLNNQQSSLAWSLSLIICIVSRYFEQFDLLE